MNQKDEIRIRAAVLADAPKLLKIYEPYVTKTAVSFEFDVPGVQEFQTRIQNTLKKYPYLVAECDGDILGYAYTGAFVGRAAYSWAAETSIYLREDQRRRGIGRKLYEAIERISRDQNILNLYACIGFPEKEDEYLTENSAQFHAHMGYKVAGKFYNCGYKFGRWYHMIWMEKIIGEHNEHPKPVIPFCRLQREFAEKEKELL